MVGIFNPEDPDEVPNLVPHKVVVSARILTYNHAPYVAQSIESVLMQETTFPFELLIGEDDSTDGTREICERYAKQYPKVIRLFLRNKKDKIIVNGRMTAKANARKTHAACRGKYVAWLEGDDYWTDKTKLQQQVEIMESDPAYSMTYHRVSVVDLNGKPTGSVKGPAGKGSRSSSLDESLQPGAVHLSSMLARRSLWAAGLPPWSAGARHGDFAWVLFLSAVGKVYFIDKVMSSYRFGVPGSMMTVYRNSATRKERISYLQSRNKTLRAAGEYYGGDVRSEIQCVILETDIKISLLQWRYLEVMGRRFNGVSKKRAIYSFIMESMNINIPWVLKYMIRIKYIIRRIV